MNVVINARCASVGVGSSTCLSQMKGAYFFLKEKVGLYSVHHTHLFTAVSHGGSPLCLLVYLLGET